MSDRTVEGYCTRCQAAREIYKTVSWQDDVCATCGGSDVETDVDAPEPESESES